MSSRMGNEVNIQRKFRLTRKVERLSVEIEYWTDMRAIEIPVDAKVTLGF